jgi:uncharacterized membrane protein SpoIIM required for sporulation/uncharacterized RDD family membrane protein YckC
MNETREQGRIEFSRRISIETPEHVVLRLELAGMGSRMAAALYDFVLIVLLLFLVSAAFSAAETLTDWLQNWAGAALLFVWFALFWGYFALFEALGSGRTPGKRRLGLRVVMDTGHPLTLQAALIRNLVRLVDLQPFGAYVVGLLFVFFHRQHKRLGDLVAGTVVVHDRVEDFSLAPEPAFREPLDAGPPLLTDDEFALLDQFVARLDTLESEARGRLATGLLQRFQERMVDDVGTAGRSALSRPDSLLVRFHTEELTRRRAKTAVRQAAGMARRFVAGRQPAWESFRRQAFELERKGLRELSGTALTRFAAEYRTLAADLARARTYGVDLRVLGYLERAVSAGHNALYGLRGVRRLPLHHLLLADLPRAVYRTRWHVVAAALLFFAPGIVGYGLVRERPDIVHEILPDGMIARAEAGAYQRAAGRGYAEAPSPYLPMVASGIITNNIQVAFGAFALGITAGLGTVLVLAFNGVFFGAVLGMFANYGLASWILTFVAGHGVLELTAIFIAGGAGLLVAQAVVAPGDFTRRDALVIRGRTAIRLVGAASCLLLLAGIIEGFLSASAAPAAIKLGVSAASAVLVGLYVAAGRRSALARPDRDHDASVFPLQQHRGPAARVL